MYNLLVTADKTAWESRLPYSYARARFLEHTREDIKARFSHLESDAVIRQLYDMPALFMCEGPGSMPAKVGKVRHIRIDRVMGIDSIRISFEFNAGYLPVTPDDLLTLAGELDIDRWEFSRTHWAIKDVDLLQVLRRFAVAHLPGTTGAPAVPRSLPLFPASKKGKPSELSGATLGGKWVLADCIGEGGYGVVYNAEHALIGRKCVVKAIPIERDERDTQWERFRREVRVKAEVRHDALVDTLDAGEDSDFGVFYIVMERLVGQTFKDWLSSYASSEKIRAIRLLDDVLDVLQECHDHGVYHRDLKPSNIFVDANEKVWLLDFGLAKPVGGKEVTRSDQTIGTIAYASPEQLRNPKSVGAEGDIWSFGVILYKAMTGRLPFDGETDAAIFTAILGGEYVPPQQYGVPERLATVISTCLQQQPVHRYPNVLELREALQQATARFTTLS